MGILREIVSKRYETGANYELGQSLSGTAVSSLFGTGGSNINVLEEYSGYAWKAINVRSKLLSSEDLFVERRVGDKWQEDIYHDFNQVLEGGFDEGGRNQSELLEAHEKSMCLYGESFWYFSKGASSNKPFSVYLLDPSCMTVMVANDKITGYVYQKDGGRVVLDLDEVAYFRDEDPRNPFRGTGPMQAAGWFIRSSRYIITYVNNFLENNAIPAGVIVAKGTVNEDDWGLFKEQWQQKYSGIDNAGKTGFIRGSDLDFVKTGLSLGEVDFEKIKTTSRDDVMLMFGISKPMFGIFQDINRASAVTARQLTALTLTEPTLMAIKRKLSRLLVHWYGTQYRISSTNPVPDDEDAKLAQYDKGINRWITINEARSAYGLPPIAGGDELKDTSLPTPNEGSKGFLAKKTIGRVVVRSINKKEQFRLATDKIEDKYIEKFLELAIPVIKEQKKAVLSQLEPKKVIDAYFNVEEEADKLARQTLTAFIGLASEQGALALGFIGKDPKGFKVTPVMRKYIEDQVRLATLGFTEDTQAYIAQALADGINAGESSRQIAVRIGKVYEDIYKASVPAFRLERIARTETARISNKITVTSYRESGVVSKKEWYANPGACTYCRELNGSIISLNSTFVPKGGVLVGDDGTTRVNDYTDIEEPPCHPGCRCRPLAVIDELEVV